MRKKVEVADLPFRINLQLHSEKEVAEEVEEEVEEVEESDLGENEQEVTEPATEETNFKDDAQNKAFAEMRRKAQEAEQRARKADELIAQQYGASHGIYTVEQYEQALLQQQQEEQRQQYLDQGVDPQLINQLLEQHPMFQQLKNQQLMTGFNKELSELRQEYPDLKIGDIHSMQELHQTIMSLPNGEKIWDKAKNGYSFLDAYETVNRHEIKQKVSASTKQKTLNNINSKQHLKTEGDGAQDGNDVAIPQETMQMYLDMGYSKKQAQAHYKKLYE